MGEPKPIELVLIDVPSTGEVMSLHGHARTYPDSPLGRVLHDTRKRNGHYLGEAARLLGISIPDQSALETGSKTLSDEHWIVALAHLELTEGAHPEMVPESLMYEPFDDPMVGAINDALERGASVREHAATHGAATPRPERSHVVPEGARAAFCGKLLSKGGPGMLVVDQRHQATCRGGCWVPDPSREHKTRICPFGCGRCACCCICPKVGGP